MEVLGTKSMKVTKQNREEWMQPVRFPCFAIAPREGQDFLLGLRSRLIKKSLCLLRHEGA
jgi:hypothetical protein